MSTRPGMYQVGRPSALRESDPWLCYSEALDLARKLHADGQPVAIWDDRAEFVLMMVGGVVFRRLSKGSNGRESQ